MIFFDNNSTTRIAAPALAKMNEVYQLPLNSSAIHQLGQKASRLVEEARSSLKNLLGGQNYEVIFTSGSTEATNLAFFGSDARTIIFSVLEHSSVFNCRPENKKIIEITARENGLFDIELLQKKLAEIDSPNFLVSLLLAHNETGAIQPVAEVAKLVHQKGGLIHCDIVQALGKIEIDLESLNVDFASISSHKICGPQGVGALLVRKGIDLKPIIFGSGQEKGKRSGTLNVAGIAGFGVACELAKKNLPQMTEIAKLRDYLEAELTKIGKEKIKIFCQEIVRLPNTSYFAIKNVDSQTALIHFDLNQICLSAGAACSSGTLRGSRVLKAMNVAEEFLGSGLRVSLGLENTKSEIDKFIKTYSEFLERI